MSKRARPETFTGNPAQRRGVRVLTLPLAAFLILLGGAIMLAGEFLGVFTKDVKYDTISSWVWFARDHTKYLFLLPVYGFLFWLAYHFTLQG